MARIDVIVATKPFEERLTELERQQLPFARSLAANQAAFETMGTVREAMPLFIDQPTSFTVRGVLYRKGNKQSPVAEVYLTGDAAKGTPPSKYLTVTRGGVRGQRRSERVLGRAGILSDDEGWVPGNWLKKNRHGNQLTGGAVVRILSQIKAFGEEGFQANVTARSRARAARQGRRQRYFVSRGGRLPRGVWERYGPGGRGVRPVMLFVKLPSYEKSFDFVSITSRELRQRFLREWPNAFRRAVRTARRS